MNKVQPAKLESLRPTQLTVGMLEVEHKRQHLAALAPKDQQSFLQEHAIPAVIGPGGKLYITDHHHLARAALQAGAASGYCCIDADLSSCAAAQFWEEMNKNSWVHPLDQNGVRHRYASIPSRLDQLIDDVYRSLAGFVRDAGGFEKTRTAFAEFVWADFFRRNIAIEDLSADFDKTVHDALRLARGPLAKHIPGYKE